MASSGSGAPGDKPPGDDPLGGKGKKPEEDAIVLIQELELAELMAHGVMPVVAPLKKQMAKKTGVRPYCEKDMCPRIQKRRVQPPMRGIARSDVPHFLEYLRNKPSQPEADESTPGEKKDCAPAEEDSSESSLDSNASDVEHYLEEPMKEYHPVFTPPTSDSEEEPPFPSAG